MTHPFANVLTSPAPMSDYTVAVVEHVLLIGFLLAVLFGGAFLILNLGLMSKRDRDQIGERNPSDLGVLKNSNWPQVRENPNVLPAAEDDDDDEDHSDQGRPAA